ncbi:MAG: apolipoprotein N-acyltransferase [Candidatus Eremiobacteraeota bacterium]|nr:apolipoprotein N-acyltransferase [Candidatus Eremiobacteraeota bacterium]
MPMFLLWSKLSWKPAFFWGWLAGTVFFLLLFYWMPDTVFDFVGSWSIVALALLCGLEGLAVAAVAVIASLVGRGRFTTASIFALPAAWLLFEGVRSHGSLAAPFGQLGFVAAHLPWLLPLAAYGGVYLVTTIVTVGNAAIAGALAGGRSTRITAGVVLAVLVAIVATADAARSHVRFEAPSLRVAVAQGNIPQRVKWTPAIFAQTMATYSQLTRRAAARGARVIVWPETAITSFPLQDPALLRTLEKLSATTHVWIMGGTIDRPSVAGYYNAVVDLTPAGSVGGVYHKRWLMPFAEFLPFEHLLRRVPILDSASAFLAGPGPHLLSAAGYQWGTLICYESAYGLYARATANAGADAIIMAADDAWFSGTSEQYQHADITVIEAVSTGRWIVRSADTGISEIVDPNGSIVAQLGLDQQGIVVADIGRGIETPYDRYGVGWLFALSFIALAGGLLGGRLRYGSQRS